jgi:hypothetical protein
MVRDGWVVGGVGSGVRSKDGGHGGEWEEMIDGVMVLFIFRRMV